MLHKPKRDDGTELEATFELQPVEAFDLIYHHKAGARDSPRSINADYHEGLELLLSRLAKRSATLLGISVDSSIALELPPEQRELALPFPIALDKSTDVAALRLDITRAQRPVARRADAAPSGGNDQKRIRITIALASSTTLRQEIADYLAAG